MKSRLPFLFFFLFMSCVLFAQNDSNIEQPVSINAAGDSPDSSAMLDVQSSSKGVLIPRMSTSDRTSISDPADGLLVYDTTLNAPCHYTGLVWQCVFPPECATLDEAYDCGGPGMGRTIFVDSGAVVLTGLDTFASALEVSSVGHLATATFTQNGDGETAIFHQANATSGINAVLIENDGMGEALRIRTNIMSNPTPAADIQNLGLGTGVAMINMNPMNTALTLEIAQMGTGGAVLIADQNPLDASDALTVIEDGVGSAGFFETTNMLDSTPTLQVHHQGMSQAGQFVTHNPFDSMETVYALNSGRGDGVHGIATDTFSTSGVTGTGGGDATTAAALHAHDGAIRVSRTTSPNTPAEKIGIPIAWAPMLDCPDPTATLMGPGGDNHAWTSGPIVIPNVYVDAARSVIMLTVEDPTGVPGGLSAHLVAVAAGTFTVQFTYIPDALTGVCGVVPIPGVILHYLIVNT